MSDQLLDDLSFDYAYIARQITEWRAKRRKTSPPSQSLSDAITDVTITDTFIGSSTLEVNFVDPDGQFMNYFDVDENGRPDAIDIQFPSNEEDNWWRMTQMDISRQPGMPIEFKLTFMERPAVFLMAHRGPVKKSRGASTRAQFFKFLTGKVKGGGGLLFKSQQLTKDQLAGQRKVSTPGGGGDRLLYAGDSLGVGTWSFIKAKKHYDDTINEVKTGASSRVVLNALKPRLTNKINQVVFDAGTNDGSASGFEDILDELYEATGNRDLVLVTLHGVSHANAANAIITDFANTHQYVTVADWDALADDHREWLARDGIHATHTGYKRRADLVFSALPSGSAGASLFADEEPPLPVQPNPVQGSGKVPLPPDPSYPQEQPGAVEKVTNAPPDDDKSPEPQKVRRENKNKGIREDAKLDIGLPNPKRATKTQIRILNGILDVASREGPSGAGKLATEAMVVAAIGESTVDANVINSIGYGGLFQGDVHATTNEWASDYTNYKRMAKSFLRGGRGFQGGGAMHQARTHPDKSPGMIAADVEKSWPAPGMETAAIAEHHYQRFINQARAIIDAYGGGFDHGTVVTRNQYNFSIKKGETYWDGMQRLAGEVNWRLFIDGRTVYFDNDDTLVRQVPAAYVNRNDPAVVSWQATWDGRRIATQMTLELICEPFEYRAGEVFALQDFGILSNGSTVKLPGRWLISEATRQSGQVFSSFTLVQPEHDSPEPAGTTSSKPEDDNDDPTELSKGSSLSAVKSDMTPQNVINQLVLPLIREVAKGKKGDKKKHQFNFYGNPITVEGLVAANANHSTLTSSGNRSDHAGPPTIAWACDIGEGHNSPTPGLDAMASALIKAFDLPDLANWTATGGGETPGNLITYDKHPHFRYQLIWRTTDHYDHVHFGVKRK